MDDVLKCMSEMLAGEKLDDALRILPVYDKNIKDKGVPERLVALQDIYKLFIPSRMAREIYSKMYLSLLRSLQKKQTILATRQFGENSKLIRQKSYESIVGGSDSFTIIGESGIGKSSAVSRTVNILSESPVLSINNTNVIPCLQVQAPADSSVKGLLLEILRKADEVLESKYHENALRSHATTDMLIGSVSQVALNHIGLLIVDEIQNVVNSKNGKTCIGTLTQLINNSGVSIAMVGTPESRLFFDREMMLARRSLGLNYYAMQYDGEFREFCKIILGYCYVKHQPIVNEELLLWLYNHSGGNVSVVVSLIHDAEEIAILDGIEKLDVSTLKIAYEKRLAMLHGYIAPKIKKASQVKTKPMILPAANTATDTVSIYGISQKAKESRKDILSELVENGIKILEVSI